MEINVRIALEKDLEEIIAIYNQAIKTKMSVAYIDELSMEDRREWFHEHKKDKYPILLAENTNMVLGWTSISPYRKGREALAKTVEVSYFVHNDFKQKGIGSRLLAEMLKKAKGLGYETIFAIILDKNIGSEKLLEKNNFEKWGVLPEVAEIDGIKMSHVYYGIKL
ncbi:MAG: N-acetyltransferase [Calditrichaceae bacterium]|nr:N-acetyltransferase [Calditrichaceae bacterium]MBN2710409.1 N-acetyltransferase [Calditrichaceae bacterium]RQV94594.1 MAG: N-acetyltransferase family protein [Calditrichota bacterium]